MGVIDKIKSYLFGNAIDSRTIELDASGQPMWWSLDFGAYSWNDRNFDEFVANGYGRNPYVFMVADRIASLVASLPIMAKDSNGEPVDIDTLSLVGAPNESESWQEFIYRLTISYLITGNSFVYGRRPVGFSSIGAINVALTQDVTINTIGGTEWGMPLSYYITYEGTFEASDVLHIRKPSILRNTNWGISPLYSGQSVYEGSNNTFKASASIHKNRGASGVLSPKNSDDALLPDEQKQLQAGWDLRNSGPEKMGKIHVTTAAMDYLPIGMNATDLRLIEFNIDYLRTICSLLGVDSSLFNDPQNKTYNNRSEAQKALYTDTVMPLAEDFYSQLSKWLVPAVGAEGISLCVDASKIEALQEDINSKHARIMQDVNAGIITAQEARAMLYPDLEEIEINSSEE